LESGFSEFNLFGNRRGRPFDVVYTEPEVLEMFGTEVAQGVERVTEE